MYTNPMYPDVFGKRVRKTAAAFVVQLLCSLRVLTYIYTYIYNKANEHK